LRFATHGVGGRRVGLECGDLVGGEAKPDDGAVDGQPEVLLSDACEVFRVEHRQAAQQRRYNRILHKGER
jgi:hypothetical protein